MIDEGREIAISKEQGKSIFNTARRNVGVDRLADGYPLRAQIYEITWRLDRGAATPDVDGLKRPNSCNAVLKSRSLVKTLTNVGQDNIADQQGSYPSKLSSRSVCEEATPRK